MRRTESEDEYRAETIRRRLEIEAKFPERSWQKVVALQKEYRERNRDRITEYVKVHYLKNKDRILRNNLRRRLTLSLGYTPTNEMVESHIAVLKVKRLVRELSK